jgi:hypothetical protein
MAKPTNETPYVPETLQSVLIELNAVLAQHKAKTARENEANNTFTMCIHAGFEYGIKRAIDIVNYEIGIRQEPPNIFYGTEKRK